MANLVNVPTGSAASFANVASWLVAEAGSGAYKATVVNTTNETTTTYQASETFTITNADVIVGVLMYCYRMGTSGTVSVGLFDGASEVATATVNASDLPATAAGGSGLTNGCWVYFKFAATATGDGGSDYSIKVKESTGGSGATFYCWQATTLNFARILVTNAAPASLGAGDNFYIVGSIADSGVVTAGRITLDTTGSATDFGTIDVCYQGTLALGTTASTAYTFKNSGNVNVWNGGVLTLGESGTPFPSDTSTFDWQIDCGSNVDYGIIVGNGGTFNIYGAAAGTYALWGTGQPWALLTADYAAGDYSTDPMNIDRVTGWKSGERVVIAATTRTYTQHDVKKLNGDAATDHVHLVQDAAEGNATAYAHAGGVAASYAVAEIINLTRAIKIHGVSATVQAYIYGAAGSKGTWKWAEFYWLGSGTSTKEGVSLAVTNAGGPWDIQYCSFRDFVVTSSRGIWFTGSTYGSCVFSYNVTYNILTDHVNFAPSSGANTASYNVCIYAPATPTIGTRGIFTWHNWQGTFSYNRLSGSLYDGVGLTDSSTNPMTAGTFTYNVIHNTGRYCLQSNGGLSNGLTVMDNTTIYRGQSYGVRLEGAIKSAVFNVLNIYECTSGGILLQSAWGVLTINSLTSNGSATYASLYGINVGEGSVVLNINTATLGVAGGLFTGADITVGGSTNSPFVVVQGYNLALNSTVPVAWASTTGRLAGEVGYLSSVKHGGTSGTNKFYTNYSWAETDATIYNTAAPSLRCYPKSASYKGQSAPYPFMGFKVPCAKGATATATVWVRKSKSTDAGGVDYAGNEPRLIVRENRLAGYTADTVLDTMTAATGTWEQLTGTTSAASEDCVFEFIVDFDLNGAGSWVNIDDWDGSVGDSRGMKYWLAGVPEGHTSNVVGGGGPLVGPSALIST